jgi:hypothetical protein
MPEGQFKLHSVISGTDLGVFAKADWVRGVAVQFSNSEPVEILEVTAAK